MTFTSYSPIIFAPAIDDVSQKRAAIIDAKEVFSGQGHNLTASLDRAEPSFSQARTRETLVIQC
ncbi:MAG: hypothetical protein N2B02_05175, partial [Amylibacter sp.]